MKITLSAIALMAALSMASYAADFTGQLMDATCAEQSHSGTPGTPSAATPASPSASSSTTSSTTSSCNATSATTAFALEANGKMYLLVSVGFSLVVVVFLCWAVRSVV